MTIERVILSTVAGALLVLGGCAHGVIPGGGSSDDDDDSASDDDDNKDDDDDDDDGLVTGLDLSRVTLNQGVEIELMRDGGEGDRNGPVVRGRDGLFRVYVDRQSGWQERRVRAVLQLSEDGGPAESFETEREIDEDSAEDDLGSTLNIMVPGSSITDDTGYAVALYEVESGSGDPGRAEWPSQGYADLDAESTPGPLRIAIVPIRYDADGSGRVPDTSTSQRNLYRDWFTRLYPTRELDLEVEDPLPWSYTVSPYGEGWGELLNYVIEYRYQSDFDDDVYVYGLFQPAGSFSDYCGGGCITGLSPLVTNPSDSWARASIGTGFPGEWSAQTMVHEVGHAHGREHAPCGVDDADNAYPYPGATLGVAGWDIVDEELIPANDATDFMGYCSPIWTSDYTWEALFDRMRIVSASSQVSGAEPTRWARALVDASGRLQAGGSRMILTRPPGGEHRVAELLDADGVVIGRVGARLLPFSHLGGGILLYPEPTGDARTLRLDGASLDLR